MVFPTGPSAKAKTYFHVNSEIYLLMACICKHTRKACVQSDEMHFVIVMFHVDMNSIHVHASKFFVSIWTEDTSFSVG